MVKMPRSIADGKNGTAPNRKSHLWEDKRSKFLGSGADSNPELVVNSDLPLSYSGSLWAWWAIVHRGGSVFG